MATEKPRFSITLDDELLEMVETYQRGNKIATRSRAAVELVRRGIEELSKKEQPGESPKLPDDFKELIDAVRPLTLDVRHTALRLCKAIVAELTLLQVSRKGNTVPALRESDR